MREIEFNRNWWLKWYWPHIDKIYEIEGHYGTRQSGKTHQIARKLIRHSFSPKKFNVIHCRKEYNKIEGSTFKILKDIVTTYFPNDFTIVKDHFQITNKHTGNWFRGLGMDKPENAKSVEGANIAWLNECNQFDLEDFDYIDTTIRGNIGVDVSIICDWNPQSASHWLKTESGKWENDPNCLLLKSTFWSNYLIDREKLHAKLLKIKERGIDGENLYRVWALGEWGIEDSTKMFIRKFSRDKHVKSIAHDPSQDLFLSFDLNYDPTCLVIHQGQMGPKVLREYGQKGLTLPYICAQIKKDFNPLYVFINGDASGHYSRNLTDNSTSYEIIKESFGLSWNQFHVPKSNPTHRRSRLQCNALFDFGDVQIDKSCVNLIADIESALVDERESLDTWKKNNPERSHWLDPFRYHAAIEYEDLIKNIGFEDILK